jgi:hypothetical protein
LYDGKSNRDAAGERRFPDVDSFTIPTSARIGESILKVVADCNGSLIERSVLVTKESIRIDAQCGQGVTKENVYLNVM